MWRGWADLVGVIVSGAAEAIFVAVVMLTRVKNIVRMVLSNISLERPVLIGVQTWRRADFPEWNETIIDQVLAVARCMRVKLSFRHFLSVAAGNRHSVQCARRF